MCNHTKKHLAYVVVMWVGFVEAVARTVFLGYSSYNIKDNRY
jgi:hypothetical protein